MATAKRESVDRQEVSLLQSVIDSMVEGIVVLDPEGGIVLYNRRAAEMWRLPDELREGDDRTLLWHAFSQLADVEGFIARARRFDRQSRAETRDFLELKDGRIIERRSVPHCVDEAMIGRIWSFRDVTAQRSAERAMERSEQRYRALFEANLAGVYMWAADGRIVDCNPAFARILGAEVPEQIIGRNVGEFHRSRVELEEIRRIVGDGLTLWGLEIELRTINGKITRVLESVSRMELDGEAVLQATVVGIDDQKRAEEQARFHAYHDILTCLPNRQLFRDRLGVTIGQARRSKKNAAVLFLDVDDFKKVNDTLGHTAGDELLVTLAERLVGAVRSTDTVARPGGDEFHILIPDVVSTADAERVARKLLHTVAKPMHIGEREVYLTASIGLALFPGDGADEESLMKSADAALFAAKHDGPGTYRVAMAELNRRASERFAVETSLRTALDREEFVMHYQPIVDCASGAIVAFEALIRWQHPERGLLMPIDFIGVAEETGLIISLGDWTIWRACVDAAQWQRQGLPGVRVAINISPKQFQSRHLVSAIRTALRASELPPELLELEVTESVAAQDAVATAEVMKLLRREGVRLSIDDIGTGYSSLNYLKQFPVTTVKIDRSFINTVLSDRSDAAIVTAVIRIAHSLDMEVVAEGIECAEQAAFLRQQQCDLLQGFHFGVPSEITAWTEVRP